MISRRPMVNVSTSGKANMKTRDRFRQRRYWVTMLGCCLALMTPAWAQQIQRPQSGGGQTRNFGSSSSSGSQRQYTPNGVVGDATITADPESRRLIVITDDETSQYVSQVVSNLDRPKPQVLIKVVFLEVTHNDASDIGVEGTFRKQINSTPTFGTASNLFGLTPGLPTSPSTIATPPGAGIYQILSQDYTVTLYAIARAGKTEILSKPSILTRNNQQATITVLNRQGGYVTGLQKDDFKLYVDGIQRPIEFFRHDLNAPVSVGILVDTSGSMEPKIPQARAAIAEFINQLNDRDDVFLFAFANRAYLLQPFTTNHRMVLDRLKLLKAYGQTALFDTIIDGLVMVQHGRWDKKALLVVTDGMDNESQAELPQVIAYARRMGVLVYSIGIGNANAAPFSLAIGPLSFGSPPEDQVDVATLRTLSNETGARTFLLKEVGDGVAMRQDCEMISEELRQQYTVGFVAPNADRGGYRSLRVDVPGHPEDTVRVRKGVTVGSGTESASTGAVGGP